MDVALHLVRPDAIGRFHLRLSHYRNHVLLALWFERWRFWLLVLSIWGLGIFAWCINPAFPVIPPMRLSHWTAWYVMPRKNERSSLQTIRLVRWFIWRWWMRRRNGRCQFKIGGWQWIGLRYTLMTAYAAICNEGNLHKIAYRLRFW